MTYDAYSPTPFKKAVSKVAISEKRIDEPAEPTPEPDFVAKPRAASSNTVAAGQLRAFIERVERLNEDKQAITDDIKEVFAEMKGTGFDVTAVRHIIKIRKQDQAKRQEFESILELYMNALGME